MTTAPKSRISAASASRSIQAAHDQIVSLLAERDRLRALNAELVAALDALASHVYLSMPHAGATPPRALDEAHALLAKLGEDA